MRYAAKRDTTEEPIVRALRKVGALVLRLDKFDLLVFYKGSLFMLDAKGRYTPTTMAQDALTAAGWPLVYVRTELEALRAIGAIS